MLSKKTILYFVTAFFLFAVDVGCTYTTFAVRGVPIEYEVNQVFRDWVIRDGWLMSIGKFTILKTLLFASRAGPSSERGAASQLSSSRSALSAITLLPFLHTRHCGGWITWNTARCC